MIKLRLWIAAFWMDPKKAMKWLNLGMCPNFVQRENGTIEVIDLVKVGNRWVWKF